MESSRRIRGARPEDATSLLAVYAPIVRHTAISFELDPPTEAEFSRRVRHITTTDPWLVMEVDGTVAGYAYASDFKARAAYATTRETTVYVHPDHQGAGVGRELLKALLDEITGRGARLAIALIALPNEPSVALYEGLGFLHAGTLHAVGRKFDAWHDVGFWELPLGTD